MWKFRIKISSSWFSNDYVSFKYTTNGIFWKRVRTYEYDVLDKWCYMTTLYKQIKYVEDTMSQFKTLDDIKKYEAEQLQRVIKRNNEIAESNKKSSAKKSEIYNKFS